MISTEQPNASNAAPAAAQTKAATKPAAKNAAKPAAKSVKSAAPKAIAKPETKSPAKPATKVATKPVAKAATPKTATKPVAKPATAAAAPKTEKAKKPKMVRDSFTIPKDEYEVLDVLKLRAAKLGSPAKKTELIRAGMKAIAGMSDTALKAALASVPSLKTGRPAKGKKA